MSSDELVKWAFWANKDDVAWFKRRYGDGAVAERIRYLMHRERKSMERVDADLITERD